MSICENIAYEITSILEKELPLYTDGISISTEPEEVMTPLIISLYFNILT